MVELSYIVRSGTGYFVRFTEAGPRNIWMTSDPVVSTRMNKLAAEEVAQRMIAAGFNAELVEVVSRRIGLTDQEVEEFFTQLPKEERKMASDLFKMERLTINELMALMKTVRERVNSLKGLRQQVAVKETIWRSSDSNTVTEPQYDVKAVDRKVMELENFLFRADSKIKTANARTTVDLDVDVDQLLQPLE